jgi:RNA polymerase sigma factor (TIGR02999 family)
MMPGEKTGSQDLGEQRPQATPQPTRDTGSPPSGAARDLPTNVTRILRQVEQGDPHAADRLLPLVYSELRKLAASRLARERPGQTLQATALVHEAYLRLVDGEVAQRWDSRAHFFAAAAEAIRRILIEQARRKARIKHGGGKQRIDLDEGATFIAGPREEFLALDEALARFEKIVPEKARLVKLRYFAGLSIDEAADVLRISRSTAKRHWIYARAWLLAELSGPGRGDGS